MAGGWTNGDGDRLDGADPWPLGEQAAAATAAAALRGALRDLAYCLGRVGERPLLRWRLLREGELRRRERLRRLLRPSRLPLEDPVMGRRVGAGSLEQ